MTQNRNRRPREDRVTREVEKRTGMIPSLGFLGIALGGMIASGLLEFVFKKRDIGNFVGLWVPSILTMGVYNKIVKMQHEGHRERDETSYPRAA